MEETSPKSTLFLRTQKFISLSIKQPIERGNEKHATTIDCHHTKFDSQLKKLMQINIATIYFPVRYYGLGLIMKISKPLIKHFFWGLSYHKATINICYLYLEVNAV
jgi:hypothetical protein